MIALLFSPLVGTTFFGTVQATTMWIQTYDGGDHDDGRCVIETSDGGFAFVGYAILGGKDDVCLVKTDSAGNEQWKQMYGGSEWDKAYSVVQTSDGGYAIAGMTWSFGSGGGDFWLVKTDASGLVQWNQTYSGSSADTGYSMVQTSDGGFVIVGSTFFSTNPGSYDFWLVKTDSAGTLQWDQNYGGPEFEEAYSVVQTSDGGYAIAGKESGDFWLVKTDSAGIMQWNQTYGGTDPDSVYSVVETNDGGYAIVGDAGNSWSEDCDILLVKTDASGNELWNQTYGGILHDYGRSMVETSDGGFAIVGYTESFGLGKENVWLIKTTSTGVVEWDQTYGGTIDQWDRDYGYSVIETSDGGYAIAGSHTTTLGTFRDDFLLIKTDSNGNVIPTSSPTPTPTPTHTSTATPTPTPTSPSPTPSTTPTPNPTTSPTPTPSVSPIPTPSPSSTPEPIPNPEFVFPVEYVAGGIVAVIGGVLLVFFLRRK